MSFSLKPFVFDKRTRYKKGSKVHKKINRPLLINQTSLKNQLISRIKNHKQNEQKEIKEKKEKEVKNKLNEIIINNKESNSMSFADEFNDSINYLS